MPDYITDTHAFIWHLTRDARLSPTASAVFSEADNGRNTIWVPGVVLVEAVYLVEKARFPATLIVRMLELVDPPSQNYPVAPLDAAVIRTLQKIDRQLVPDMPDRIIVATAQHLGLPLLSKDLAFAAVPDLSLVW